ncbi:c-type cytochrome [Mucilaginibacter auburnensis]|uniref:Cytochrome c551/c552 n=1 Tax=Mucilaginibacter auburnensis TaxID=1457233 RepID=A0A2H9VSX5_9SPHI|nr:c-type cytochrome [Mucilaginibacter auburnensis]PJJ83899.1 cytochrome c551/c552 [Mucilaginibacter auburnensis]
MRSISLIFKQFTKPVLLALCLAVLGFSAKAQGDPAKGEGLFKSNACSGCHALDKRMAGPALGPIMKEDTDDKWLTKWIQNNQALIAAKDPKALKIYNEFGQAGMPTFPGITDADAADIIAYVRDGYKKIEEEKAKTPVVAGAADKGPSDLVVYGLIGVIILAFIIILVLNRVIGTLENIVAKKGVVLEPELVEAEQVDRFAGLKKMAKNKKLVFFVLLCAVIGGSAWQWNILWNTDVHTGYQPVQPIKYSHELHAGIMKIECQYCHSGAFKSKNASIPSLNVCMNCHNAVKTESPEIQKIYAALGYDPETRSYDASKAHPIQWVRIHNLPDLAYFNHSQHTTVGGIKCQTCHGPIETMAEVKQYSPLTMKWCIQCHKRTEVNAKGSAYYDQVLAAHDEIKKGKKPTVAMMGGIECGKCHY